MSLTDDKTREQTAEAANANERLALDIWEGEGGAHRDDAEESEPTKEC